MRSFATRAAVPSDRSKAASVGGLFIFASLSFYATHIALIPRRECPHASDPASRAGSAGSPAPPGFGLWGAGESPWARANLSRRLKARGFSKRGILLNVLNP